MTWHLFLDIRCYEISDHIKRQINFIFFTDLDTQLGPQLLKLISCSIINVSICWFHWFLPHSAYKAALISLRKYTVCLETRRNSILGCHFSEPNLKINLNILDLFLLKIFPHQSTAIVQEALGWERQGDRHHSALWCNWPTGNNTVLLFRGGKV